MNRDPYVGWPCGRECAVCKWKPRENVKENCNLQNLVYKGICKLCEEEEKLRMEREEEESGEVHESQRTESSEIITEYIGETCKSLYIRSSKHMEDYRLLKKESFILKHHIKAHPKTNLGEVQVRFVTHIKHQTCFRRQISEAVAIKLSRNDPKKRNINN